MLRHTKNSDALKQGMKVVRVMVLYIAPPLPVCLQQWWMGIPTESSAYAITLNTHTSLSLQAGMTPSRYVCIRVCVYHHKIKVWFWDIIFQFWDVREQHATRYSSYSYNIKRTCPNDSTTHVPGKSLAHTFLVTAWTYTQSHVTLPQAHGDPGTHWRYVGQHVTCTCHDACTDMGL